MILFALAAAALIEPAAVDLSDVRTVYSGSVDREGWPISPDCEEWTKAREDAGGRATELQAWAAGVITGYNVYHPADRGDALNLLERTTLSAAYTWIDQRCADAPEAALPDVTLELVDELRRR